MAYITADQLTLERMSKMDTGEFELALSDLRDAGLTEQGATFLSAYVNPPYQARLIADASYAAEIARIKAAYEAAIAAPMGSWVSTGSDYMVVKTDAVLSELKWKLDYLIAADAGRRHNEKFKGIAPYLYLWPFSFYDESKRIVNNIPLIFGFKLNGEAMQTEQEYFDYWLNNPAINWPDIPITNLYADTAYRDKLWNVFLDKAPDYKYFLSAIKHLIGASRITLGAGGDFNPPVGSPAGKWSGDTLAGLTPLAYFSGKWGPYLASSGSYYEWFPVFDHFLGYFRPMRQGRDTASGAIFSNHGHACPYDGSRDVGGNYTYDLAPYRNTPMLLHLNPCGNVWPDDAWRIAFGEGYRRAINKSGMPWKINADNFDRGIHTTVKDFPATVPYSSMIGSVPNFAFFGNPEQPWWVKSWKWNTSDPNMYFGTASPVQYLNSLELLRHSVWQEVMFRFRRPPPPQPRRKRSWFWKFLSFVPFILPFLAPIASIGNLIVKLASVVAGQVVAKQVGGVLGAALGAITGGTVSWTGGALGLNTWGTLGTGATPSTLSFDSLGLNAEHSIAEAARLGIDIPPSFQPIASSLSPSAAYSLSQSVVGALPVGQPIQKILGAGLDAAMNNYVGIPASWLNTISANPLIQASMVAASIAAPQQARIGIGSLALATNIDKLTPTSFAEFKTEFVPVTAMATRIALPEYSREIKTAAQVIGYTPNLSGDWSIPDIGDVIAKIPEYIIEGIEESGKAILQAPQLAVKGLEYAATHVQDLPPLILEGVEETGKVVLQSPELVLKGAEFVATKAPPIILEGVEETGKVILQSPELAVKGMTFLAEKAPPIILEGFEETGKALLQVPSLIGEGLSETAKFLVDVPQFVATGLQYIPQMSVPQMQIPVTRPEIVIRPPATQTAPRPTETVTKTIPTVQDGKTTYKEEQVVTSKGTTGEEIIHLQAVPIQDNNLSLTIAGTLAIVALAALTDKKN